MSRKSNRTQPANIPAEAEDFVVPNAPASVAPITEAPDTESFDVPEDAAPAPAPAPVAPVAEVEQPLPADLAPAFAALTEAQRAHDTATPKERRESLAKLNRIRAHVFKIQQGSTAPVIEADDLAKIKLAAVPDTSNVLKEIAALRR